MPNQQLPWWMQYQLNQTDPNVASWNVNIPGGPPPAVRQQQAIQAQQYQQQFQNQPDIPPVSPQPPTTAPEALPGQELGTPSPTPTATADQFGPVPSGPPSTAAVGMYNPAPFDNNVSNQPGSFFPADQPPNFGNLPANTPPVDSGSATQPGGYFPADNPPDFSNITTNPISNPTTNETSVWTPPDTYFGGNINPTPDVPMIANPSDTYFPPDLPPNLSNVPANVPPNEQMVANPIAPEPTQSGLSLSGTPDLSIGGSSDIQPLNYYPDGSGGYVVYDNNWNVVNNMPGTGPPGEAGTGTISSLAGGDVPLLNSPQNQVIRTDTGTANQTAPSAAPPPDTGWTQNPPGSGPLGPGDTGLGGFGQSSGFFGIPNPTGSGSFGVGGGGGTLAGGGINIGPNASPSVISPFSDANLLPGATSGLGSFGPGSGDVVASVDPGVYGFGGNPGLLSYIRSLGFQNIGQWVVASGGSGPGSHTGGGGGQTPAATGGVQ